MYRTHTCGELTLKHLEQTVTLSGWVQRLRNLGGMTFVDLRDRYGITQLVFNQDINTSLCDEARKLGREYVIQASGKVIERSSKNANLSTGDIEVLVDSLRILNKSDVPPFTIEDNTDGGDELRMKYRYLDLRRNTVKRNLELRHRIAQEARKYLDSQKFIEVETPVLINSTPEGARDFIVPSRMNPGKFYALPQSPQTLKQLLMVAGYDRYFQIVKCFRDEDLRADRQPEFTQIDCEMSFVEQEDILNTFEGLIKHLFKTILNVELQNGIPQYSYEYCMDNYGCDKPDLRFEMKFQEITSLVKGKGFGVFDNAEYVAAICVPGCAAYTRKQTDELQEFVQKPQIGAKGLIYIKVNEDGTVKSSIDKFYNEDELRTIATKAGAKQGDLILVMAGARKQTQVQLCALRLEMGERLGLRDRNRFVPLWVVDFPLFEWNDEDQRYYAMHHAFTSPKPEDVDKFNNPGTMHANAYDMVINGVEVGGGSIRIFDKDIQQKMFDAMGFSQEESQHRFGFLMNAFRYGAPPHGGIAFGFDRLTAMFAGLDSIRDVIAFPKNNAGRDVMLDSPSDVAESQLNELFIQIKPER